MRLLASTNVILGFKLDMLVSTLRPLGYLYRYALITTIDDKLLTICCLGQDTGGNIRPFPRTHCVHMSRDDDDDDDDE